VPSSIDIERLLAPRVLDIETSGIRRAWALAADCVDPINLSMNLDHTTGLKGAF
jgi:hypothetical protein